MNGKTLNERIASLFLVGTLALCLSAAAGESAFRDLIRVQGKTAEEPWLRINAGGHTGTVQALAFTPDSKRLCSAGLDKSVLVWNLTALQRDLRRTYLRERTIRWQVARSLRGSIYALAAAPSDGLLAFAGYGAMGSLGEILLVEPLSGRLVQALDSHRQTVCSLAFSTDGNWLVSSDVAGQVVLWNRAGWKPTVLRKPDQATYGAEAARRIAAAPKLRPIAVLGNGDVAIPIYQGTAGGDLRWQLSLHSLNQPEQTRLLETVHEGLVTALAASPDGTRLASADLQGRVYVWDLTGDAGRKPLVLDAAPCAISMCFSPDGKTLVAGTAVAKETQVSQVLVWDAGTGRPLGSRTRPDHVTACAVSPDGTRLAYSGGRDHEITLSGLTAAEPAASLRGTGRRVWKVAFARQDPLYRIAWGTEPRERGFNDYADLDSQFDPAKLELGDGQLQPDQWLAPDWTAGTWTVRREANGALQLREDGQLRGRIELDPALEGRPRCYCWIPGAPGEPRALAVGTDVQNSLYVFGLAQRGRCPIWRQFRGHQDFVTSVGVSRDARFLVSGSADGTIIVWSLDGLAETPEAVNRWGAEFAVQENTLRTASLQPAGPLFRRGLRPGDLITEIRWPGDGQSQTEHRPAEMLARLQELPWLSQVVFRCSRNGQSRPAFQLVPAWQPLATLFVDANREWAFWTPEGYYDASINGHTLFGWQVNRGLHELPDFYRADQYAKTLERPEVLQRLLPAGSLDEALRQADVRPKVETQDVLPEHIAATPVIEIVSPRAGELVRAGSATVMARIGVPAPGGLVRTRLYANGVVATQQRLIRERAVPGGTELEYEWTVPLPSDPQNLIQLVALSDAPTAALDQVLIERPDPPAAERTPRLSIIAVGVNRYVDPAITTLDYSRADAEAVLQAFRDRARGLYTVRQSQLLVNEQVTRAAWRESLGKLAAELSGQVSPDDLIILFLAGHGVVDPKTDRYYFVGHDLRVQDYLEGKFSACISWEDFRVLSDIPCRKLVVLDTCHSGALQPLSTRSLKTAVRALQEDVFLSLTASAGNEKSEEDGRWGHGAFTMSLLEALDGRADTSADGLVTLQELVRYTQQAVPKLTAGRQNPTAAPDELLPLISIPLGRGK